MVGYSPELLKRFLIIFHSSEFLLGDDIIAAPVITANSTNRDIYLPEGQWTDGNTQKVYKGPVWIMEYEAPLSTLPYFLRVGFQLE